MSKKRALNFIWLSLRFSGLVAVVCSLALAGEPILKDLQPHGAQLGTAFQLTLIGTHLAQGVKIISPLPAFFTPLTTPRKEQQGGMGTRGNDEVPFLVELRRMPR